MKNYSLERGSKNIYSLRPQKWEERHQTFLIVVGLIAFIGSILIAGTDEFNTIKKDAQLYNDGPAMQGRP